MKIEYLYKKMVTNQPDVKELVFLKSGIIQVISNNAPAFTISNKHLIRVKGD